MEMSRKKGIYIGVGITLLVILIIVLGMLVWNDMSHGSKFENNEEVSKEVVEDVITREDNEYFEGKKLVAITFDDGPGFSVTEGLLDELDKRDAKVSFFLVGNRVQKQADLIKRMSDSGHSIGNHSYSHKSLKKQKPEDYLHDINNTNQLIKDITGKDVIYLRPPYGSYKKSTLENVNMNFVLWSVDTLDWKTKDVDAIYKEMTTDIEDGDIILLHDLYPTTTEAAIKAIDYLLENGYAVVSLDEMYRLRGLEPEMHKAIRHLHLKEDDKKEETTEEAKEENQDEKKEETSN